ncbi:gp6-like head-tail connector protein [Lachnotalea glycerini]|uniref:Gp6-like head-tail connector protein n=1 Tax=Lachnotalea glycerini TaxID=1763509 RepID=A0A318EI80_9FIRM|nr:phage head-tail connector protein [Lachnotalea glycerini]PXV85096.1 gp6-like head-tail connector protein [Lachnotalea glycerini]
MDLSKLKRLLGLDIDDKTKDVPLQFIIDNVKEMILNYCNMDELPEGLFNTAYRMAIDLYRNESPGDESTPLGTVSSITTGDTSTSFLSTTNEFKDSLLKDYKKQLNRYRRIEWM